jgi:hypothetical protein
MFVRILNFFRIHVSRFLLFHFLQCLLCYLSYTNVFIVVSVDKKKVLSCYKGSRTAGFTLYSVTVCFVSFNMRDIRRVYIIFKDIVDMSILRCVLFICLWEFCNVRIIIRR